jgi:hypothetical protein
MIPSGVFPPLQKPNMSTEPLPAQESAGPCKQATKAGSKPGLYSLQRQGAAQPPAGNQIGTISRDQAVDRYLTLPPDGITMHMKVAYIPGVSKAGQYSGEGMSTTNMDLDFHSKSANESRGE